MQVETFECHETAAEPIEASEEAINLIDSLGLEGQRTLICPTKSGNETRSPYREMTAEEQFVYGVLCSEKTLLKDYAATSIPLRVLQVAAHAESLGMFKCFEVWDRATVEVKDPVLVAYDGDRYSWNRKHFILARWGEELEAFATLLRQAVDRKRQQFVESLQGVRNSVDSQIAVAQGLSSDRIVQMGSDAEVQLSVPSNWAN